MIITMGFAGGFTGAYFAAKGDPFWTVSGGLAGVISVSAGADVYAPTLGYVLALVSAIIVVWVGTWIEEKMRVDDTVGAVAVHGFTGFLAPDLGRDLRRRLSNGAEQRRELDLGPAAAGSRSSCRSASSRAGSHRWLLKKLNLLRVPPEVELDGLDTAEYAPDIHVPEFGWAEDLLVEPDGVTRVPAQAVQDEALRGARPVPEWRPPDARHGSEDLDARDHRQRPVVHLQ